MTCSSRGREIPGTGHRSSQPLGADASEQITGALVAIIGVIQIIFGGFQRKSEDLAPAATEPAPQTP
jgi:hypothetical protein